jgi:hypothetical protein
MVIFNFKTYKNEKKSNLNVFFAAFEKGKNQKKFYLK